MDIKKFEKLKQQAILILYELDMLTGDGSIIHKAIAHRHYITYRIQRIERMGETTGKHYNTPYTVDSLEQKLKEANAFIAKVKLRGR